MTDTETSLETAKRVYFKKGETIFRQDEAGDVAYLLQSGLVRIVKTVKGRDIELGLVEPLNIFGEFALLDSAPRSATAIAEQDCACIPLQRDKIEEFTKELPPAVGAMIRAVVRTARTASADLAVLRAQIDELMGQL